MLEQCNAAQKLTDQFSDADAIRKNCNKCDICLKECTFLASYGAPGLISEKYKIDPDRWGETSFECSLCGLCTSVCPKLLDPAAMFLDFRTQAVGSGQVDISNHQRLINYEAKGASKKYSLYSLPENCDTIFFPGCSLTGTRPDNTLKTYQYLQKHINNIGIVLDCCTKPSRDLGRRDHFSKMFCQLKGCLLKNGINTVIVACPSCYDIFNSHAPEFSVETIYEIMAGKGLENECVVSGDVTIHDPCSVRFETNIQESVRSLVRFKGLSIIDTTHKKDKTFCCGEGGDVACVSPEFALEWSKKRAHETHSHTIVSYCAGCVNFLSKRSETFHILDLIFDPEKTIAGKAKVSKAPFTYLNRIALKKKLKKLAEKTIVERHFKYR
ncbi:MAG: (Fe-S)-binding protein [Desulfobacula sp.]|nr:(Fe-S)-binding protein [Desulfobacula sp.]